MKNILDYISKSRPENRERIYKHIDKERNYQDYKWGEEHDEDISEAEWIIYLETILHSAKQNIYDVKYFEAMSDIRKLAAVAIACLEYNEFPEREF